MRYSKNTALDREILRGLLQMSDRRVFFSHDTAGVTPLPDDPDREWREAHSELHPFREVMVVLSGELQFQLASRVYEGRCGDVALIDYFERHDRLYPPRVKNCVLLWMQCYPHAISCLISTVGDSQARVAMHFSFLQQDIVARLNSAWKDAASGRKDTRVAAQEINGVITIVMASFAAQIMSPDRNSMLMSEVQNQQYSAVMAALSHINGHLRESPQLGDLARNSGYSTPHFARLFRQYSGYGFRDYIDYLRLRVYRNLHNVKRMPKKEIALELGFSSTSSLIHWMHIVSNRQSDRLAVAMKELAGND